MTYESAIVRKPFPREVANLGFMGVLFEVIGFVVSIIPFIGTLGSLLSLVGTIMLIISYFRLAKAWQDEKLRNLSKWYVIGLVATIIASIIVGIIIAGSVVTAGGIGAVMGNDGTANVGNILAGLFAGLGIGAFFAALFVLLIYLAVKIIFYYLYAHIASISGISQFKTTGLLFLIGTLTSFILIGFVIMIIGAVFHIIAWSKAKESSVETETV